MPDKSISSFSRNCDGETEDDSSPDAMMILSIEASLLESGHPVDGSDSEGVHYESILEMWQSQGVLSTGRRGDRNDGGSGDWYRKALDYWEDEDTCPATVNGVLGGFSKLSPIDLTGSREFLEEIVKIRPDMEFGAACECGAGIGRVSKGLLLPFGE